MLRLKRALAAGAVACVALVGLTGPASATGVNPAMNKPSYWGTGCVKVEYSKAVRTYYVKAYTRVIIKAGTGYYQFDGGAYGRRVTVPKDISFVITCSSKTTTPKPPANPYPY